MATTQRHPQTLMYSAPLGYPVQHLEEPLHYNSVNMGGFLRGSPSVQYHFMYQAQELYECSTVATGGPSDISQWTTPGLNANAAVETDSSTHVLDTLVDRHAPHFSSVSHGSREWQTGPSSSSSSSSNPSTSTATAVESARPAEPTHVGRNETRAVPSRPKERERKHHCEMCHKSFDRPSTLRKHILVHTGEKAFACETCGRRFGVASNLNRHTRKCAARPVNIEAVTAGSDAVETPITLSSAPGTDSSSLPVLSPPTDNAESASASTSKSAGKRKRSTSDTSSLSPQSSSPSKESPKRRRRPPTPTQWIPNSLRGFNILTAEHTKSTPVPLAPVVPSIFEERDSWDEEVGASPYHPSSWKGRLPGPGFGVGFGVGLGGRSPGSSEGTSGGSNGFMMGRLVFF